MAKKVYLMPACLVRTDTFGPQSRTVREREFFGKSSQATSLTPRAPLSFDVLVNDRNFAAWDVFADRLGLSAGGADALFAMTDQTMRLRRGWDDFPAVNSSGNEFWRANGRTEDYAGESANPPTGPYRSIFAQANGAASADATSLAVDGLLAGEIIPAGTPIRIGGTWRYTVRTAATANGSGEATLQLGHPLRAAVANNDTIRIPGDLSLFDVISYQPGASDEDNVASHTLTVEEVYASEVTGGVTWVVD